MKNKKREMAIAINYAKEVDNAPTVSAQGEHRRATEMKKIARRYGIPLVREPKLTKKLFSVPAGNEIPASLYQDIAKLLVRLEKIKLS